MHIKLILPALTEARGKYWRAIKYSLFPPLGLATLAGYLDPSDRAEIVDEHVEDVFLDDEPDLVAIEVYVTSAYRAYRIADAYRKRGTYVVLGGLHVTACPEEASAHADTVVLGTGQTRPLGPNGTRQIRSDGISLHNDSQGQLVDLTASVTMLMEGHEERTTQVGLNQPLRSRTFWSLATVHSAREARKKGARALAVCNVVGSTLARESSGVLYTHAGPEIGVASTKAFYAQNVAGVMPQGRAEAERPRDSIGRKRP
jgi:hypothetical protein